MKQGDPETQNPDDKQNNSIIIPTYPVDIHLLTGRKMDTPDI